MKPGWKHGINSKSTVNRDLQCILQLQSENWLKAPSISDDQIPVRTLARKLLSSGSFTTSSGPKSQANYLRYPIDQGPLIGGENQWHRNACWVGSRGVLAWERGAFRSRGSWACSRWPKTQIIPSTGYANTLWSPKIRALFWVIRPNIEMGQVSNASVKLKTG